ncbi:MAG: PssD/Cps14F family polysaccharide biosynthesis glycosyltransferase [Candidatus Altiarchaeota archaeon]
MKVCLVCSHGGHLTEMLELVEAFEGHKIFFVSYRGSTSEKLENAFLLTNPDVNPLTHLVNAVRIFFKLLREHPDVVFSTGAEIAISACWIGKLLGAKIAHLECSAQVNTPSTTGRLVYPISDLFLVQWESLLKEFGSKARCVGGLI